jgi:hypothetical protein
VFRSGAAIPRPLREQFVPACERFRMDRANSAQKVGFLSFFLFKQILDVPKNILNKIEINFKLEQILNFIFFEFERNFEFGTNF